MQVSVTNESLFNIYQDKYAATAQAPNKAPNKHIISVMYTGIQIMNTKSISTFELVMPTINRNLPSHIT